MKTYEEYKQDRNLEIFFEGKQYVLTEDAEMYTYWCNNWEIIKYTATAIDEAGNLYSVTWEVTEEFEKELEEAGFRETVDEQDACDWENPITVEKIEIW